MRVEYFIQDMIDMVNYIERELSLIERCLDK